MGQKQSSTKKVSKSEKAYLAFMLVILLFLAFKAVSMVKDVIVPSYAAGDCLLQNPKSDLEKWEVQKQDSYRVLELGNRKYRLQYTSPSYMRDEEITLSFLYINTEYHKVECGKGEEKESRR